MLVQVRTDNHINNSEGLAGRIQAEIEGAVLPRYTNQLRRVEVYLQDVNSHKGGLDTRCSIEAQLSGHQPVAVHDTAANVETAVSGAIDKLMQRLEHTLGRLRDKGGPMPASGKPL